MDWFNIICIIFGITGVLGIAFALYILSLFGGIASVIFNRK